MILIELVLYLMSTIKTILGLKNVMEGKPALVRIDVLRNGKREMLAIQFLAFLPVWLLGSSIPCFPKLKLYLLPFKWCLSMWGGHPIQ